MFFIYFMKRWPAPTPLACKREPGVGLLTTTTTTTPLVRKREPGVRGFFFSSPTSNQHHTHPPRSQTRAGGGHFITYQQHNDNGAHPRGRIRAGARDASPRYVLIFFFVIFLFIDVIFYFI
jgi:hypothetical protein